MSGGFPFANEIANAQQQGVSEASSAGVALPAVSAANTKSAWAEISASTPIDACMADIFIGAAPVNENQISVDIALGAAGSERIICPDLLITALGESYGGGMHYFLPLAIPAGSRISARWQCNALITPVINVGVCLFAGGFNQSAGFVGLDTYGFDPTHTQGTSITAPTANNTWGAWTEIVTALTNDIAGFIAHFDSHNHVNTGANTINKIVDIGIGPSGSEQILIPQFPMIVGGNTDIEVNHFPDMTPLYGMALPAGTRIAMRQQMDDVSLYTHITAAMIYGLRL